jgi:membrane-associated protease RseP (regulator of RpoE activity)
MNEVGVKPGFLARLDRGISLGMLRGPVKPRPQAKPRLWLPPLLLVLTVLSTIWAGYSVFGTIASGAVFSATLLCILGVHESGHFLAARRWGVPSSLPYFIPFPLSLVGTMGAVIRLRAPIFDRRALFDIGIAGPLSGWILSVVAIGIGYGHAQTVFRSQAPDTGSIEFGSSLLMFIIERLRWGDGVVVLLNPFLYAGWIGMLVTALNLMPIGQLDGGHILHAMFPRGQAIVGKLFFVGLIAMSFFWSGWAIWAVISIVIGVVHPPTADDGPIGPGRNALGYAIILIFVLTFIPVPVQVR